MSLVFSLVLLATPCADVAEEVFKSVEMAMKGESKKALSTLERLATKSSDTPGVEAVLGLTAYLASDSATARRVLGRVPEAATGAARAELGGPGGFARARTRLVEATKGEADAETLFLAALAFSDASTQGHRGRGRVVVDVAQDDRAHEFLSRALEKAESALDPAFAPDPLVELARATMRVGAACGNDLEARTALLLFDAGRRAEAFRLAEKNAANPAARGAMLRILINATNASDARRALVRVEKLLSKEPTAEDALAARVVLLLRAGQTDEAARALSGLSHVEDPALAASLALARAKIALSNRKDIEGALVAVESAIRDDPKNDEAVATYSRLLIATQKIDRAAEFAVLLLGRKPKDVDPFQLLVEIHEAKKQPHQANDNRLRSKGFLDDKRRLERLVIDRESVFRAIRDAEAGVGVAGLEALRGEYPQLSLPIDLALARLGNSGAKRAARERVLSRCGPALVALLKNGEGFDFTRQGVSFYGVAESVDAPLTAAEPTRCDRSGSGIRK